MCWALPGPWAQQRADLGFAAVPESGGAKCPRRCSLASGKMGHQKGDMHSPSQGNLLQKDPLPTLDKRQFHDMLRHGPEDLTCWRSRR